MGDVLDTCFGLSQLPPGKSIEDLFQEAIDGRRRGPLEKLTLMIQAADHYLTPHLGPGGDREENPYRTFLEDFPQTPILTFNYDSLVEILLLGLNAWRPEDGFGVEVAAELHHGLVKPPSVPERSSRVILHLHGTFCVYASTFFIEGRPGREVDMIRQRETPQFLFDPDTLGRHFFPFERAAPGPAYRGAHERVIAPVPNKAEGLKGEFIVRMHDRAVSFLRAAEAVTWIGYSFNPHDLRSFDHLVRVSESACHTVVDPDATEIVRRLRGRYQQTDFTPIPLGFANWVSQGYPAA